MLAKIICWGETREEAIRKLASAVQDTVLLGVNNNKFFLQNVLHHPDFQNGSATTAFIEQHFGSGPDMDERDPDVATLALAASLFFSRNKTLADGWRNSTGANHNFRLRHEGEDYAVSLQQLGGLIRVTYGEQIVEFMLSELDETHCTVVRGGVREAFPYAFSRALLHLDAGCGHYTFQDVTHEPAAVSGAAGSGDIKASMDGAIIDVLVAPGERVAAGQTLVVLEAMKMEHQLKTAIDGVVESVNASPGDQVKERQILVSLCSSQDSPER